MEYDSHHMKKPLPASDLNQSLPQQDMFSTKPNVIYGDIKTAVPMYPPAHAIPTTQPVPASLPIQTAAMPYPSHPIVKPYSTTASILVLFILLAIIARSHCAPPVAKVKRKK